MIYIFENIVKIDSIYILIEKHFEDAEEQEYLRILVRDTIHHKLVDMVLDELAEENKALFLTHVDDEKEHQSLLNKLRSWIDNFEEKLHLRAKEAEGEMLQLIDVA